MPYHRETLQSFTDFIWFEASIPYSNRWYIHWPLSSSNHLNFFLFHHLLVLAIMQHFLWLLFFFFFCEGSKLCLAKFKTFHSTILYTLINLYLINMYSLCIVKRLWYSTTCIQCLLFPNLLSIIILLKTWTLRNSLWPWRYHVLILPSLLL